MDSQVIYGQTQTQAKKWKVGQVSLLTKALLIAGISFLLICAIGVGFGFLFQSKSDWWAQSEVYNGLMWGSIIGILVSMILSMFWASKIMTAKPWFTTLVFFVYIVAQGCGFGIIFGISSLFQLGLIFGVSGLIFLITGITGLLIKDKAAMTFRKFIMIGSMIALGLMFIISMVWMFDAIFFSYGMFGVGAMQWFYYFAMLMMGLVMMGYMAYDIYMIQKIDTFLNVDDNALARNNIAFFFGYKLLVDLVGILWIVAMFVLRFTRN